MPDTLSVLAQQRAQDAALCERLREHAIVAEHETPACTMILPDGETLECGPSVSQTVMMRNPDGEEAAARIEALHEALAQACHDRDKAVADGERMRAVIFRGACDEH